MEEPPPPSTPPMAAAAGGYASEQPPPTDPPPPPPPPPPPAAVSKHKDAAGGMHERVSMNRPAATATSKVALRSPVPLSISSTTSTSHLMLPKPHALPPGGPKEIPKEIHHHPLGSALPTLAPPTSPTAPSRPGGGGGGGGQKDLATSASPPPPPPPPPAHSSSTSKAGGGGLAASSSVPMLPAVCCAASAASLAQASHPLNPTRCSVLPFSSWSEANSKKGSAGKLVPPPRRETSPRGKTQQVEPVPVALHEGEGLVQTTAGGQKGGGLGARRQAARRAGVGGGGELHSSVSSGMLVPGAPKNTPTDGEWRRSKPTQFEPKALRTSTEATPAGLLASVSLPADEMMAQSRRSPPPPQLQQQPAQLGSQGGGHGGGASRERLGLPTSKLRYRMWSNASHPIAMLVRPPYER